MSTESQALDAYDVVLADLRAQRERIDVAIRALEQLRGVSPQPAAVGGDSSPTPFTENDPGAFLGMTVVEATKKLLLSRRKALPNAEIVASLEEGGLVMNSVDKLNTVNSILTRRFKTHGDLVRVKRGVWGLQEWYGSRNFKAKARAQDDLDSVPSAAPDPIYPDPIRHGPSPLTDNDEPDPWGPADTPYGVAAR